ncbi:MAG: efflux RND transporter permease subunit [Nitratireductor sp.]|nr:efflux RND transporter permease subunit [Nitratireductor sp.]
MTGALETILSRPKTVLTMMVVMVLAGLYAYATIPKEAQPDIDVPVYYVSIGQRGVSPEDAERLLVKPMETELRGLDGLKEITAIASEGHAGIVLEFQIGSDKDKVLADIRDKVDLAKANLPADADEPAVFETNFALQPTIIVTLSGDVPERTLYNLARQLKDEVEAISSVREVKLKGTREEQLEVVLDLLRLQSYDITQQELLNALAQYNQLVPAGFIDDGAARFNVKLPGLVETAQDVYSIPIKQNGEGVVTLGEVAQIRRTFKDASSYTRVNGQPAMSLEVVKRIGTNIVENNEEVRRVVGAFTQNWPSAISINYMLDQSTFIFETLGSLQSSILTAISLVMIIVVGSLGFRSGLLVGLAIPTSFMVGFLILTAMGMTLNMMVMFGLVLTVGMLVDGAIVMIEYADRKMAEGLEPDLAYKRAAKLMLWPIVSSTATTLAAFLPLLLWPGVVGEFMSYLPIMVIVVLSASLLTALVFVPATGSVMAQFGAFLRQNHRFAAALYGFLIGAAAAVASGVLPEGARIPGAIGVGLVAALAGWFVGGWFGRWRISHPRKADAAAAMLSADADLDPQKLKGAMGIYVRFLDRLSGNLIGNMTVIVTVIAVTIGTFVYFGANNNGVEFFVEEEPDVAILFVQARGNLSGREIRDLAVEVEQEVLKVKGLENVVLTATAPGGGGGGGGIDLSAPQDTPPDVVATMQIEFIDFDQRRPAVEIFDEIRQRTARLGGVKVEIRKMEGGPPTGKDIRLQVTSDNYDQLVTTVGRVRDYFDTIADIQDVEDSRPLPGIEWEINVDREEAGRYNAGVAAVGSMVQLVTTGVTIGKYRPDDSEDEVDIVVRLPEAERSLDMLSELRLRTQNGQVPISNFIDVTAQHKVTSITRRDGLYAMDIKAGLVKGAKFGDRDLVPDDKVKEIQSWLDGQDWPLGVRFRFRGADEDQKESGAFLQKAALGALFLMFIILLTQFNSFYQTFLTLSTVILAMVGVLIGMLVTGQKFSIVMSGTGIVALAGIVVNNAIVLIDTYNRMRSDGAGVHEAVLKTSAQRFRPIFLTTFTTILGLFPMALAINFDYINREVIYGSLTANWWVQLSTAVISGLAFSTMLTLVVTPVMLSLPTNVVEAYQRRALKRRTAATPQPADISGERALAPANDSLATEDAASKSKRRRKSGKDAGEAAGGEKAGGEGPSYRDAAE